jgi:hypothetical protein
VHSLDFQKNTMMLDGSSYRRSHLKGSLALSLAAALAAMLPVPVFQCLPLPPVGLSPRPCLRDLPPGLVHAMRPPVGNQQRAQHDGAAAMAMGAVDVHRAARLALLQRPLHPGLNLVRVQPCMHQPVALGYDRCCGCLGWELMHQEEAGTPKA